MRYERKSKTFRPSKEEKADNKTISYSHGSYDILDKDDIFEVNSDFFTPAAMSGVINDKSAPKLLEHAIKIIVEAANIPTTPTADEYLNKNCVWIIPDFLTNAGAVISSFVEYQGRTEKKHSNLSTIR